MSNPFIRPYHPSDFENGLQVFLTTIDAGIDWEPARTIGSYIWYRPYVILTPGTCFVLDDGTGRAVGYIIGATDTLELAEKWRREFLPTVNQNIAPKPETRTDNELMERDIIGLRKALYNADCSMLQCAPQQLGRYPAHLHIDIMPAYQKRGWGPKMMDVFIQHIKQKGASGVHLGMVRTNEGARRFYGRLGFQICDEVLDDGASGELGRQGDAICLVKAL